jgi:DNA-3-methyladenine glycosylase
VTGSGAVLPREFFARPAPDLAPALLGCVLHRDSPAGPVAVLLTEVEAYAGPADPASHAYRGRTPRNAVMFGPPGHAYVYFTYGMHFCVNLVCEPAGRVSAILLRAGRVIEGAPLAAARRAARRSGATGPSPGGLGSSGNLGPGGLGSGGSLGPGDLGLGGTDGPDRTDRPGGTGPPGAAGAPGQVGSPGRRRIADRDLARGPARLCQALGIDRDLDGADACDPVSPLRVLAAPGATATAAAGPAPGGIAPGQIRSGPRVGISQAVEVPWRFWIDGEPSVSSYRPFTPRHRSR